MRIRLKNAMVLTMAGGDAPFPGEVQVDGSTVAYAGPAMEDKALSALPPFDRVIDCGGDLLLPGFKNAHAHSAMTFLRSLADDLPLHEWLFDKVFPLEAHLTPEDVYPLTKLAILEYLTSGITAAEDMYFCRDAMAQAMIDTGFRGTVMDAVNNFGGSPERTLAEYERINKLSPLVRLRVSVHGEYTTALPLLKSMAELCHSLREPLCAHMNETAREVEECVGRYGKRPFELFDELGLFDYGGTAYHCVHVSHREREIIKARGVYPVTCPASNMKLSSGVAPIYEFLEEGLPVAIGTDGPASNNCLDMFREMFLVTGLQKLRHGPEAVDALAVLRMACVNGARAMGLFDADCLAPGKQADLIRIDLRQPNMQPVINPAKNLVYSGSKQNVRMTMVAGRILYEDGRFHVGDDPESVYAAAARAAERIRNA